MITQELLAELRSLVDQIQDFESQCSQSGEVEQDKMAALESQLEMLKNLKKTLSQSSQEIQKLRKENKGQIKGELTEELNKELAIQAEAARQIKAQEEKLQNEKRVEAERLEKVRAQKQEQRRREQEQQAAEEAARKSRLEAQRAAQQAQEEEEKIKKSKGDKDKQEGELHNQFQESQARQQAIKDKMEKLTPKKRAGGPSGDEASKRNKSGADSLPQAQVDQDTEMSEGRDASGAGAPANDVPEGSSEYRGEGDQDGGGTQNDYDMPPENGGEDQEQHQSPDEYRQSLISDLIKIKVADASGNNMDLFSAETNHELRKVAQDEKSGQIDPADFLAKIIANVAPNTIYESLDLSGNSVSEMVSKIDQEKGKSLADEISARFERLDSANDNADLLFHMKRFNADRTKNNQSIGNDAIFIAGRGAYELTAFIVHRGGVEGGHYVTYVKEDIGQGQSKWFLYDDSNRTEVFDLDQSSNLPIEAQGAYFVKYSDVRFLSTQMPSQQSGFSNTGKNYCWLNSSLIFLGSFNDFKDKIRNFIDENILSQELGHSSPVNPNPAQERESSDLSADNNQSTLAAPGSTGKIKKKKTCSLEGRAGLTSLLVEQKEFRDFIKSLVIDSSVAEDFLLDQSHFKAPAGVNGNKWTALHYIAYTYDSASVQEIISVAIDTLVKNSYNDQEIKIRINNWINKFSREGKTARDILEDMKKVQDLDYNDIVKSIEFLDSDIQPRINYFRSNSGVTKGLQSVKRVRKSLAEGPDMRDSFLGQGTEQSDINVFEKIDSKEIDSDEAAALEKSIIDGKFSEFISQINSEAKKKHIIFEHILNGSLIYKDYRVLNAIVVANVGDGDSLIKDSESFIDNAIKILAKEGFPINDIKKSIKSLVEHYDPKKANIKGCLKREIDSSNTEIEEKKNLRKCNRLFGQSGIQKRIDALQHRSEISKDISVRKSARLASNKSPEQGHITLADKGAAKILLSLGAPNLVSERVEDPITHSNINSEKISKDEYRNLVKSIEELTFGDFIRSDDLSESKKKYIIFDHIFSRGDRKSCSVLHAIMNYTRDEDFSDVFESFMQTAIEILIKEGKDADQILEELFVVINKKDGDGFTVIDYLSTEKDYIKNNLPEEIEDIDILDEYLESMSTEAMTERVEELRERLRDDDRDSTLSDQDDVLSNSLRSMQVDDQRTQTDSTVHDEFSIPDTGGASPAFQVPGVAPSPSASSIGAISSMSQGGWEGAQTLYGMYSKGDQGHGSGR